MKGDGLSVCELVGFFLLGTSSWLLVTALFAECSYWQTVLPEDVKIFTLVDTYMESGNVVPALLVLYLSSKPSDSGFRRWNKLITTVVVLTACAAAVLQALTWHLEIDGKSLPLLLGAMVSGGVGSTAMISYFGFAAQFGPVAISATSAGIGACGLITNVFGILQGLNKISVATDSPTFAPTQAPTNATQFVAVQSSDSAWAAIFAGSSHPANGVNFSPTVFYFLVAAWLVMGVVSFAFLERKSRFLHSGAGSERAALLPSEDDSQALVNATAAPCSNGGGCRGALLTMVQMKTVRLAVSRNHGLLAAIWFSCMAEFAMPALVPYLVPCGPAHASTSFWLTVVYLTSSLVGRLLTSLFHFRKFALLNTLSVVILAYAIVVCRMRAPLPVELSAGLVSLFSIFHGFIVTKVFQLLSVNSSKQLSGVTLTALGGLFNQFGALTGSLLSYTLIITSVIEKRTC